MKMYDTVIYNTDKDDGCQERKLKAIIIDIWEDHYTLKVLLPNGKIMMRVRTKGDNPGQFNTN